MATTILNRALWSSIGDGDGILVLDASEVETHEIDIESTDHPVELGADVTDHARLKPRIVTIQGCVSDTPINDTARKRIIQAQGVNFESTSLADAPVGGASYSALALEKLEAMFEARQLVTVVTSIKVYTEMMPLKLTAPRDGKTGDALRFTASFKKVRFAELQRQTLVIKAAARPKKTDAGTVPATPTPSEQLESLGHKLLSGSTPDARSKFVSDKLSPAALGVSP